MDIAMEELVPIVGKLAEQYTAYEHTSMPCSTASMKQNCLGREVQLQTGR